MTHSAYRLSGRSLPSLAALALLSACGGGGGSAGTPVGDPPTVSSATASTVMFSRTLTVTVNGSNLDSRLTVASPSCSGMTRSSTAPYVSSSTTAYYQCRAVGVGAQAVTITRSTDGSTLATVPFTVAMPQVAMAVSNGAGVAGTLLVTLAADKTPVTVANFLDYVNAGFYAGTVFHRVSPGFVLQGGGYAGPVGTAALPAHKATNAPIPLEVNKGLSNTQWTIAMARTSDPNSATSEFFVNLVNNASLLDPSGSSAGYAVFGDVSASASLVQAITAAPCQAASFLFPGECLPVPNVTITSATQTQ